MTASVSRHDPSRPRLKRLRLRRGGEVPLDGILETFEPLRPKLIDGVRDCDLFSQVRQYLVAKSKR